MNNYSPLSWNKDTRLMRWSK